MPNRVNFFGPRTSVYANHPELKTLAFQIQRALRSNLRVAGSPAIYDNGVTARFNIGRRVASVSFEPDKTGEGNALKPLSENFGVLFSLEAGHPTIGWSEGWYSRSGWGGNSYTPGGLTFDDVYARTNKYEMISPDGTARTTKWLWPITTISTVAFSLTPNDKITWKEARTEAGRLLNGLGEQLRSDDPSVRTSALDELKRRARIVPELAIDIPVTPVKALADYNPFTVTEMPHWLAIGMIPENC